jgi:hypothetical protein
MDGEVKALAAEKCTKKRSRNNIFKNIIAVVR